MSIGTQIRPSARPPEVAVAILRVTLGVLFVWVFVENYGKGLYTAEGYAALVNSYIQKGHAPETWKAIMSQAASHASVAAPMQAAAEMTFGVCLLLGVLTRPVALAACLFLTSLWVSELGTAWIWELLVPMVAALCVAIAGAGRTWGVDALLARRYPDAPLW